MLGRDRDTQVPFCAGMDYREELKNQRRLNLGQQRLDAIEESDCGFDIGKGFFLRNHGVRIAGLGGETTTIWPA